MVLDGFLNSWLQRFPVGFKSGLWLGYINVVMFARLWELHSEASLDDSKITIHSAKNKYSTSNHMFFEDAESISELII